MFDLYANLVTYAPIEPKGTKFVGYAVIETSEIYEAPMSENLVRKNGLDPANVEDIAQSFANGIDYSEMPPVVYKRSQIVNGVHYKYVLAAGHHRFKALKKNKFEKWVFGIYEFGQSGYSFEESLTNLQLVENNNKNPHKESTKDDVINTVVRLIAQNSKLVTNDEDSIRAYVDEVCPNKAKNTRGAIVRGIIRACGTYQAVVTYASDDVKKWILTNTDYAHAGNFDEKRKKFGWSVKEGYEDEYIMSAVKKYHESQRESYFLCHAGAPTEKEDINTKRIEILKTFQQRETALKAVFDYYKEHNKFPWNVEGFLPQDHKNNESTIIKPQRGVTGYHVPGFIMNERIKELARIAEVEVQKTLADRWSKVGRAEFMYIYNQKFAHLIVQDCIDRIETYQIPVGNSPAGEMACEWTYDALKEIRDQIKEHFGVKG